MAEIALAVVPLCFEAFRLGRAVRSRLTSFRAYMSIVEEHRVNFDVQIYLFVSECERILQTASKSCPGVNTARLIDRIRQRHRVDPDAQLEKDLSSPEIDESLRLMFGSSIETLMASIKLILGKISTITGDLDRYGQPDSEGQEVINLPQLLERSEDLTTSTGAGSAMNRTQNRITLALNNKHYTKTISELKALVSNLQNLRRCATVETDDGEREVARSTQKSHYEATRMPPEDRIRGQDAALLLHGMRAKWSCDQEAHAAWAQHAKLLLSPTDASALNAVTPKCLDILIHRRTPYNDLLSNQLRVLPMPKQSSFGLLSPASSSVDEDRDIREPKRRRLGLEKEEESELPPRMSGERLYGQADRIGVDSSINLTENSDMCSRLCGSTDVGTGRGKGRDPHYYLDFKARRFKISSQYTCFSHKYTMGLDDVFRREALQDALTDAERFWLASVVVKSALRHFDTAWWTESWTLDDLRLFDMGTGDLIDSLKTLHLSSPLPTCRSVNDGDTQMSGHSMAMASANGSKTAGPGLFGTAAMEAGIRNSTLWGVGVALLQIGLCRRVPWYDHVQVRSSVASLNSFSQNYHDITDKLINCDFGKGAKLQKLELQNEVYRSVVCELESTLQTFREAGLWGT